MNNKKLKQLLSTGILTSALVFGGATVFANDDTGSDVTEEAAITTDKVINEETPAIEETNTTPEESSIVEEEQVPAEDTLEDTDEDIAKETDENTADETVVDAEENTDEVEMIEPSLIPGDFFYFVKLITEKIRLAVTFDDYKEAQLLAEFAAERIAEANTLIVEGKTEEVEELLKEAISLQDLAGETLPEAEVEGEAGDETAPSDGDELGLTVVEETEEAEETEVLVENKLANNIDSLLVVLEKVENKKAQQAILKNIQKSFVKLDKKLQKLDKANTVYSEKMNEIDAKLSGGLITVEEAEREKTKLADELDKKLEKTTEEEARDVEEINSEVAKETAAATKEQKKLENEAVKEPQGKQREEVKKAEEKQREEGKKAAEKQREEAKKAEEKQREEAKKAAEKQREEAKKAKEQEKGRE